MSAPRVLHVVPHLLTEDGRIAGGGERYPFELARHMALRAPTRLLSFGRTSRFEHMDGIPVRIVGGKWHEEGREHNPMSPAIFREVLAADVVHCHQREVMINKAAALSARVAGKRIVVTDHGGGAWDWTSRVPTGWLFQRHLHVSRFSLETTERGGVARGQVILGGVDADRFRPARGRRPSGRALFVGRLLPHKGVDDLIAGLPERLGLDIVGAPIDARYVGDLHELARGRDVVFYHDFDDAQLVEMYRSALCIVLPSKYEDRYGGTTSVPELLGQTLLEGMACGRPAVCTRVGGMPEVVVDGKTGFVVEPAEPAELGGRLAWLRDHPNDADALGRAARERILAEFTWDRVVDRCLATYAR